MNLTSKDFTHNQKMDPKFTCDGENLQPQLAWDEVPDGTKSFAVSCLDPDAPSGEWAHWLVINIPATINSIEQNAGTPAGSVEIDNDFKKPTYGGPCPPSGTHQYVFKVYALDVESLEGVDRQSFKQKVSEHTLDSAEVIGLYERK